MASRRKLRRVNLSAEYCCSFCGAVPDSETAGAGLISGPNRVFICFKCVELCSELRQEHAVVSDKQRVAALQHHLTHLLVENDKLKDVFDAAHFADEAMATWFSSEYVEHPKRIALKNALAAVPPSVWLMPQLRNAKRKRK